MSDLDYQQSKARPMSAKSQIASAETKVLATKQIKKQIFKTVTAFLFGFPSK